MTPQEMPERAGARGTRKAQRKKLTLNKQTAKDLTVGGGAAAKVKGGRLGPKSRDQGCSLGAGMPPRFDPTVDPTVMRDLVGFRVRV